MIQVQQKKLRKPMIWSNDVISYITSRQLTIIRYSDMPILTIVEPWV